MKNKPDADQKFVAFFWGSTCTVIATGLVYLGMQVGTYFVELNEKIPSIEAKIDDLKWNDKWQDREIFKLRIRCLK